MIITTLDTLARYRGLSPDLDTAFDWLESGAWKDLPVGKHTIDGTRVFALAQAYETKAEEDARYEAHRKYLDIQMLVEGEEYILAAPTASLEVTVPYSEEKECLLLADPATKPQRIVLVPGVLAILYPEDAHKPSLRTGNGPSPARKVVMKVRVAD